MPLKYYIAHGVNGVMFLMLLRLAETWQQGIGVMLACATIYGSAIVAYQAYDNSQR